MTAMTSVTRQQAASVSFELFPPKTAKGVEALERTVDRLAEARPGYFSVTYGAGGSTRERTRHVVDAVAVRSRLPIAHHLTCVGASRSDIDRQAEQLWDAGIRRIVALRGDLPEGASLQENGYRDAAELVAGLRRVGDFDIAVAAYPEVHPEAASAEADLEHLKRKLDAGANAAITQFVFDTDTIVRFIDRARSAGLTAPIVPGIMPVANFAGLKRFASKCGATIPPWMEAMFAGLDDDPELRAMVATSLAVEQCRRLVAAGISEFHIYTLNKPEVSLAICRALGIPVAEGQQEAA